jgi:hypothetical protein
MRQAEHNERVANHLAGSPEMYDWGITAAFYSAIHYLEAKFFSLPAILHTETSIPEGSDGKLQYTAHAWRQAVVREKFPPTVYKAFRKLRENSEIARYLSHAQSGPGWSPLDVPATQFFKQGDAHNMLRKELHDVKSGVDLTFCQFICSLGLELTGSAPGPNLFHKLVGNFRSRDELLAQTPVTLTQRFSPAEIQAIEQALSKQGLSLSQPKGQQ